jgi:hypothetical protein
MRIVLLALILAGCAGQPTKPALTLDPYVCYIIIGKVDDNTYLIKLQGDYSSKEEAVREATEVQTKLMYIDAVPITSEVFCRNESR